MKKPLPEQVEKQRIVPGIQGFHPLMVSTAKYGNNGMFIFGRNNEPASQLTSSSTWLRVIISDQMGWDHVSVSKPDTPPTWEEMAFIKDTFFEPEETVMQLHPPRSRYVNMHPNCLHLWRPQKAEIPLPPIAMV